ncbi:MAG: hypothetical protein R3C03_05385 [Pirellulaceae bacterium]
MNDSFPKFAMVLLCVLVHCQCGCRVFFPPESSASSQLSELNQANPLPVPLVDPELAMNAVSDELDDYFRIHREQRIRIIDGIITEGWVETHKQIGATYLEPWRKDSTFGFERAHATLQTVRRFAKVRLIPNQNRYLIDVKVYKELEDKPDPEHSTISSRAFRHDNSLDYDRDELLLLQPNRGWIPMGRDFSLEQQILTHLKARFDQGCQ